MAEFCDKCDVSMDLHWDEDDCESAQSKADLITGFWAAPTRLVGE